MVTGVFVNTAIESAGADKDIATLKQMQQRMDYINSLQEVFREIDEGNANVAARSFKILGRAHMRAYIGYPGYISTHIHRWLIWAEVSIEDLENALTMNKMGPFMASRPPVKARIWLAGASGHLDG